MAPLSSSILSSILKLSLPPQTALRFIVPTSPFTPKESNTRNANIAVRCLEGTAEIKGAEIGAYTELVEGSYEIFTWFGAVILISTIPDLHKLDSDIIAQIESEGGPSTSTTLNPTDHSTLSSNSYPDIPLQTTTKSSQFKVKCVQDVHVVTEFEGDVTCVNLVNTHAQLEVMREDCIREITTQGLWGQPNTDANNLTYGGFEPILPKSHPPRVLILGSRSSGRHTISRTLTSYAMKLGRSPLAINLDPSRVLHGLTPVAGSMGCKSMGGGFVNKGVVDDWKTEGDKGGGGVVWWYGRREVEGGREWYSEIVDHAGGVVERRGLNAIKEGRGEGLKEYSSGWIATGKSMGGEEGDKETARDMVQGLGANVVIVVDWNNGYNFLREALDEGVKVIKIPKSGGVRGGIGKGKEDGYFKGVNVAKAGKGAEEEEEEENGNKGKQSAGPPFWRTMKVVDLNILQCSVVSVGSSMLPMGQSEVKQNVTVREVDYKDIKDGSIAAVVGDAAYKRFKETGFGGEFGKRGVMGFVVMGEVKGEEEDRTIRIGTNVEGGLPGNTLVIGEGIEWVDK